ncbi:Serine/threonine-protein kinase 16, partial [Coelomomyces lativittatus]
MHSLVTFIHTLYDTLVFVYQQLLFFVFSIFDTTYQRVLVLGQRKLLIVKQIAAGGFSNVYLVSELHKHRKQRRYRALKRIYLPDHEAFKFFQNEVRIYNLLQHPHIMKLITADVFSLPNGFQVGFILMPYYSGGTLQTLLENNPQIPFSYYFPLFRNICLGLQVFHLHSIIFRDLK